MTVDGATALGIYISVPFCRSKCTYCNFASGVYPAADHERYVDRVVEDITGAVAWAAKMGVELPRRVDTVYLGGGTPSLLAPALFAKLFAALRAQFDLDTDGEITVECAPGQLAEAMPEALAAEGVNRVSLGVQSFVDAEARASGRLHSRAIVEKDLRRLRAAGITNLNLDLIAGLAGQTLASWKESLDKLIDLDVPHCSVYMLEVDEDSRLGREMLAGGSRYRAELVPSDDIIVCMYERAIDLLETAGLRQYEISNFSRPGSESRHNLRYWNRRPYLGLGLDASSALRAAEVTDDGARKCVLRSTTSDDLGEYLRGRGSLETTWLSPERQFEEAWFLGLRMNTGVEIDSLKREFGCALVESAIGPIVRLAEDGFLTYDGKRVRLTPRGRLISNEVFERFLATGNSFLASQPQQV